MKQLKLGVFEMLNPSNGLPTWTHPKGRGHDWDRMEYWVDTARMLDAAGFDFLFFADTYGFASIEGRVPDEVMSHGIQFPGLDPMLLISALAQNTTHLGFVVTSPTTVEHPYATARRFASLDHFTDGRIGWNIVTGSSQATTDRLFGMADRADTHDGRYERAEEFVEVCRELWEHSWEEGADARSEARGVYADPAKIRAVAHSGAYYDCHGPFAVSPGRQRTPVLFQAGTSTRGREFAAKRAEAIFIQGQNAPQAARQVAAIRAEAVKAGRSADSVKIVSGMTVVLGDTTEAAAVKRAEMEALFTREDAAVLFAGMTGVDLRALPAETLLTETVEAGLSSQQGQTLLDRYVKPDSPVPTIGEVLDRFRLQALRGFQLTGTPEQVADEIETLARETDLDGFMLEPTFGNAEAFSEFADAVMPILRRKGLLAPLAGDGPPKTLRERLAGGGSRLLPTR